jgi:hypothetical protein
MCFRHLNDDTVTKKSDGEVADANQNGVAGTSLSRTFGEISVHDTESTKRSHESL